MSAWYRKNVGDGIEAKKPSDDLHNAFFLVAASQSLPDVAGVFSVYDLGTNVVTWYFSPGTEILARKFGAEPCEKPKPYGDFGLLAGKGDCWSMFFPGHIREQS